VRLLVTRPEADGERTAAALRQCGHEAVLAPLLRIDTLVPAELGGGPWSALAVTSANAVHAIEQHPRRAALLPLPLFAVGARTAATARAAGFAKVVAAGGDLGELAQRIRRSLRSHDRLLYLAGEERSGDLARDLAGAGIDVRTVVVYRAVKADGFPRAIGAALAAGQIDGVLHFSRRSAQSYLDCAAAAGVLERALRVLHFCLSRQVAEPLADAGAEAVRIAARPEEAALIDLVGPV
jgi:uroporphyrinogen-III synthase